MISHDYGTDQRYDHFAIRVSLEMIWLLETLSNHSVVVDFAIDGKCETSILVGKRLRSTLCFM